MSDKPSIVEAFAAAMAEVQAVKKADRNNQQGYSFRGIDAVVNAVGPVFRKHGIVPIPHKSEARYRDVQTSTGKPSRECTVTVTYRFYGPAGDYLEAEVPGESMDFGDKGAPKAMSVAYRIVLLQALCIPTDEPEPDASTYERAEPVKQRTDYEWLKSIEGRIQVAANRGELTQLAREISAKQGAGQCEQVHADHLWELGRQRQDKLGIAVNKDGSLSRSRMSDEALAREGAMTKEQAKEHNALVRSGAPDKSQIQTGPLPADEDPWIATGDFKQEEAGQ